MTAQTTFDDNRRNAIVRELIGSEKERGKDSKSGGRPVHFVFMPTPN